MAISIFIHFSSTSTSNKTTYMIYYTEMFHEVCPYNYYMKKNKTTTTQQTQKKIKRKTNISLKEMVIKKKCINILII